MADVVVDLVASKPSTLVRLKPPPLIFSVQGVSEAEMVQPVVVAILSAERQRGRREVRPVILNALP